MLRHITSTLTACALAGTVSLFAQEPPPAQPPPAQPEAQETPTETVTGCVVEAKTTDGGTVFVLSNAQGGSATMYVLAGSSQAELSANVNKRVEVTGPVKQPTAPPAGDEANPKVLRPALVQVQSVTVVADTCK